MDIGKLRTNKTKETEGVWTPFGSGLEVKLCRIGSPRYEAYLRQISKPVKARLKGQDPDVDLAKELLIKAMGRTILVDWKDMEEQVDGELKPVPYSEKKAIELLTEIPDFYSTILEMASDMTVFQDAEDEGNLLPS